MRSAAIGWGIGTITLDVRRGFAGSRSHAYINPACTSLWRHWPQRSIRKLPQRSSDRACPCSDAESPDAVRPGAQIGQSQSMNAALTPRRQFGLVDPAMGRVPPEEIKRSWSRHNVHIVPMIHCVTQMLSSNLARYIERCRSRPGGESLLYRHPHHRTASSPSAQARLDLPSWKPRFLPGVFRGMPADRRTQTLPDGSVSHHAHDPYV